MVKGLTYADAGVDIELGDDVSKILYEAAKQTWANRKGKLGEIIVPNDDFSGVRAIRVGSLPKSTLMNMSFDGVGTKIEFAERAGKFDTISHDLLAMVCDDAVVRGAEPVLVGSILDVNSLKSKETRRSFIEEVRQLAKGYVESARDANVAIVNGETAELGNRVGGYGEFNSNWGAAVVWFADEARMLTGKEIKEGDKLVGLEEKGFRSNGLSLVRKVLEESYGKDWHTVEGGDITLQRTLEPSKIYSAAVVEMMGGYDLDVEPQAEVHGVAHITGGGLPGKLGRMLKPSGLGATIDQPFTPPPVMRYVQGKGHVPDKEAYRTWNMGQGMVIATPDPENVIDVAKKHKIHAREIGKVTETNSIMIRSAGYFYGEIHNVEVPTLNYALQK